MTLRTTLSPSPLLLLLVLSFVPWAGAAGAATGQETVTAIVQQHILPRYAALQRSTAALAASAARDCPDREDNLKAAYHAVMDDWMRIQHIRFGPIHEGTRLSRIQYWPDRRGRGQKQLASLLRTADPERLEPDAFAGTSVAVQGLPALETLLFKPGRPGGNAGHRCAVIAAIGRNLADLASAVSEEWRAGPRPFRRSLEQPGPDDPRFRSADEVIAALRTDLHTSVRVMIDLKLKRPLGAQQAHPKRAESWRSRRSLRNIRLNAEAINAAFEGEPGPGLSALLRATPEGAAIADQVGYVLKAVFIQIDAIDKPLYDAVANPADAKALRLLIASLETLDAFLLDDVSTALDLPLGFNALDGD